MTEPSNEELLRAAKAACHNYFTGKMGQLEALRAASDAADAAVLARMSSPSHDRAMAEGGWQPIESAPKNPSARYPQSGWLGGMDVGPFVLLAFAYPGWDWATQIGWWGPKEGCWRFIEDDGADDVQPTHWMPLPAPPTPTTKEETDK